MAKVCAICSKGNNTANRIIQRGKAKRLGGVGRKTTGISRRQQKPNLQKIKALVGGSPKRIKACTTCIRSGKVERTL